jgi:hypothetical protein
MGGGHSEVSAGGHAFAGGGHEYRAGTGSSSSSGGSSSNPSAGTDVDLTVTPLPAGITAVRSGGTVWPQLSASTVQASGIGNNLPIFEDTGDGFGGGVWAMDSVTNDLAAAAFDFASGWTADGTVTYTPNAANGPDGAANADRASDGSAVARAVIQRAFVKSVGTLSVFVKDVSGAAPTNPGSIGNMTNSTDTNPVLAVSLGSGTSWRRKFLRFTSATANLGIFPAGAQQGVDNLGDTGAVDLWGMQVTSTTNNERRYKMPLVTGAASGICTLPFPAADLGTVVSSGEMDFEVRIRVPGDTPHFDSSSAIYWAFRFDTPGGECSARWVYNDGTNLRTWIVKINGVDVLQTLAGGTDWPTTMQWLDGDEVVIRVYASATRVRLRVRVNGAIAKDTEVAGNGALTTPTAGWLLSNSTTANNVFKGRCSGYKMYSDHTGMAAQEAANGVVLGDSTFGFVNGNIAVASAIYNITHGRAGKRIGVIAKAGDTIAGQKAKWDASPYKGSSAVTWVAIQVGINDVVGGSTAAAITAAYQGLVDDIAAANPLAKIVTMHMLPADGWASMNAGTQQKWIDVNKNIDGSGSSPVTGAHAIITSVSAALNQHGSLSTTAGQNLLGAAYDTGDHVHENNDGRLLDAAGIVTSLTSLGVYP